MKYVLLIVVILFIITALGSDAFAHQGEVHKTSLVEKEHLADTDKNSRVPQIITVSAVVALGALLGGYIIGRK